MSLMKILCGSSWCLLCACLTGLPAAEGAAAPADLPESRNDEQQCAAGDAAACLSLGRSLLHAGASDVKAPGHHGSDFVGTGALGGEGQITAAETVHDIGAMRSSSGSSWHSHRIWLRWKRMIRRRSALFLSASRAGHSSRLEWSMAISGAAASSSRSSAAACCTALSCHVICLKTAR